MKTPKREKKRDIKKKNPVESTVNVPEAEGKRGVLRMDSSELFISPTKYLSEILAGCNFSARKKETMDEVTESEKIKIIQKEYVADIQEFRKDISEKITANEKSITNFNLKLTREKKQIDILEQKNKDLKNKLDEYEVRIKDNWTSFKSGFIYEMNLLEQELYRLIISPNK